MQRSLRLASLAVLSLALCVGTRDAAAARIGVLSNNHADAVAADFTSHVAGHVVTAVDVSTGAPWRAAGPGG